MPHPIQRIEGPPATGKSTKLLAPLREALARGDDSVRLVVPSATMAAHLRNQLAREGLLLRRNSVQTLAHFLDGLRLLDPTPSTLQLDRALQEVFSQNCPASFAELASSPGFRLQLLRACEELALGLVPPNSFDGPVAQIYGGLREKVKLRGQRLEQAAKLLSAEALAGLRLVLFDGFYQFSRAEESFLTSLNEFASVVITVPQTSQGQPCFRQPVLQGFIAQDCNQEALFIGQQVLELAAKGVALNRIGVILRNPILYEPILTACFARLNILCRNYSGQSLAQDPVTVFFRQFIAAAEAGWENGRLLEALRWRFTGLGACETGDRLDFAVRQALPSDSLEAFPELLSFSHWAAAKFLPAEAAKEMQRLGELVQRENTAPLLQLIDATAITLPEEPFTIAEFWKQVEIGLSGAVLHSLDQRREVVHILDIFESRQWELDYVFAPGLTAEDFPQRHSPDALLPEALRRQLGLRTLEDRHKEELFLAEVLLTRARESLWLLYPAANEKGAPQSASPLLPCEFLTLPPLRVAASPYPTLPAEDALGHSYRPPKTWSASELESYLSCPWKHFAAKGLELQGLPESPAERLNNLLLGSVAHAAIHQYTLDPSLDIETIGERQLEKACREVRAPMGFQYERARINLLRNLRHYARNAPVAPAGWQSFLEQSFELRRPDGVLIRGRIDRYDQSPNTGEIHVYDYKYSRAAGLDEKYPVQGGLYAKALGPQVSRLAYVALREQAKAAPIEGESLTNAIALAEASIEQVLADVEAGKIPVRPADRALCQYCDYRDACRIRTRPEEEEPEEAAMGAGN